MKNQTTILALIAMLMMTATPTTATSTAVLGAIPDGDQLTLHWDVIGAAGNMTLHWIDSTGDHGNMTVTAEAGAVILDNPPAATLFILQVGEPGSPSFSNPVSNWPRCDPQSWVAIVGYPPFVAVSFSCINP